MATPDQSDQQLDALAAYSPAEPTYPSFLRPRYVKYNSVSKSKDLGSAENLIAEISGVIGAAMGSSTLFFALRTTLPSRLSIRELGVSPQNRRWLSVGILDQQRRALPLATDGTALRFGTVSEGDANLLSVHPPGTYYFTISTSQWSPLSFALNLSARAYAPVTGIFTGTFVPTGRLALAKLDGAAVLQAPFTGTFVPSSILKLPSGAFTGQLDSTGSYLSIFRGTAQFTFQPQGRFSTFFYLNGQANFTFQPQGALTVTRSGGYGY